MLEHTSLAYFDLAVQPVQVASMSVMVIRCVCYEYNKHIESVAIDGVFSAIREGQRACASLAEAAEVWVLAIPQCWLSASEHAGEPGAPDLGLRDGSVKQG